MRDFTHFVVANSNAGLSYLSPLTSARDLPPFPQRIVRWGCSGPYLIAWGHTIVTHKPLPDDAFLAQSAQSHHGNPIGNWIRKRRQGLPSILHP